MQRFLEDSSRSKFSEGPSTAFKNPCVLRYESISTYKCRVARTCVQESCRTTIVFGDRPFLRLFGKLLSSDAVDQHASYFVNGVRSRLPLRAERVSTRAFRFHVRLEHTTSVVRRQRSSQRISQIGHLTRESPIVQRLLVLL